MHHDADQHLDGAGAADQQQQVVEHQGDEQHVEDVLPSRHRLQQLFQSLERKIHGAVGGGSWSG